MAKEKSRGKPGTKGKGRGKRKDEGGDSAGGNKDEGGGRLVPLRELLRVPAGERPDLGALDPAAIPAGPADKAAGVVATAGMAERLGSLQERLYAASTAGDRRRVLLVLQGMDTSGKGGTVKHVIGLFNPSGCRIQAFKAPTPEEREHPFLWRVEKALPCRARSASSTVRTTRTSSSPGSVSWRRATGWAAATPGSTSSRSPSRTTASPW